jgi:glyoxylate reductase
VDIVVTRTPPGRALEILGARGDIWLWAKDRPIPRSELLDRVGDARALYAMLTDRIDEEVLAAAPQLVVVSNMAVGVDNVDLEACTARGIPVGHTPDVLTETTADTAFALLMMAARRLVEGVDYVRDGEWGDWEPELLWGQDVHTSTLGIIGFGRVGEAVATRGLGFGMRVLYHSRHRHREAEQRITAVHVDLETLLAESDHVVVATPLTPQSARIINAETLGLMKSTATLVNISRGGTVDTEALVDALRRGVIGSAGLDVTDPEPLPGDHPLVMLPNCVVTPHLGSSTERTRAAMAELAAENLIAGLEGRPLPAQANLPDARV